MIKKILFIFILLCVFSVNLFPKNQYTHIGESAYAKGNYDYAFSQFQKAINAGETRGEPWFFMGSIKDANREYSASIPYFEKAVERPLKRDYKIAALWKIVLFYKNIQHHEKTIEYARRLNKSGVYHSSLTRIIENAKNNLNPNIAKSREYLDKAISEDKKLKNIDIIDYSKYKDEILYLISNYQRAIDLNPGYASYLWRVGYYQEKLEKWDQAFATYQKLAAKSDSLKVQYKLGVIEKHRNNFNQSLYHLRRVVLESNEKQKRLKYYAHLNLAQSYFAVGNNNSAKIHSYSSIKLSDFKVKNNNKSRMEEITYCLAAMNILIEKKKGKTPALCKKLLSIKHSDYLSEELVLINLIQAKQIRMNILASKNYDQKQKYETILSQKYMGALFTYETKEEKISPNAHFTGEFFLNQWAYRELKHPIYFFYHKKKYKTLILLSDSYPKANSFLNKEKKIHAYYQLKNFEKVLSLYEIKMSYPSFQKALLASVKMGNNIYAKRIINHRIQVSQTPEQLKYKINKFLQNSIFDDFRDSKEYKDLNL